MTVSPDWTPPEPPRPAGRLPISSAKVWTGVRIAISGHLLTILIGTLASLVFASPGGGAESAVLNFVFVTVVGQIVLAVAALPAGIILVARGRDGGVGAGILAGWAVGLIVSAALGYGVALWLAHSSGPGSIG